MKRSLGWTVSRILWAATILSILERRESMTDPDQHSNDQILCSPFHLAHRDPFTLDQQSYWLRDFWDGEMSRNDTTNSADISSANIRE
jgi:hypothetical protein